MPDASRTASSTPLSTHRDFERLCPVPRQKPLLTVFSWLVSGLVHRNPLVSATVLCMVLICGTGVVVSWSYNRDMLDSDNVIQYASGRNGIGLIGHGYQVDVASETMSFVWEVVGCGEYRLLTHPVVSEAYLAAGCDDLNRAVDIYLNGASAPTFSYDPAKFPLLPRRIIRSLAPLYTFGVDHVADYMFPDMVPFDTYTATALAFVIEKATNESVPIILFAACGGPNDFVFTSVETKTTSNYIYDSGMGPTTVEVDSSVIEISAKRSQLARAFTICLLLVNWALAIGSTYVTLVVVVRKERVHEGVLLLPVTLVLTIPTLRGLYVGSPPFGIYLDTFGFFLQMMIVAICSMILLYIVATPSAQDRPSPHDSGDTELLRVVGEVVKDGPSSLPHWMTVRRVNTM